MLKKKFDRGRFYTRANPKGFGFEVLQALYLNEEEQEKAQDEKKMTIKPSLSNVI